MSESQTPYDYNWELEDHGYLQALPEAPMTTNAWQVFSRPAEIDASWHNNENQGQIGSCQGNGLSSVLERLAFVQGKTVQLSRIFAYLATQKIDGLLGADNGSTIAGGCKLAVEFGCPLEATTGYPSRYPNSTERTQILSQANYGAGAPYKAKSAWQVPKDHNQLLDFIGGGGGITFGVRWYNGLIPQDRIVRSFRPVRCSGGHAMCVLGYDTDGNLRAYNSWGDGLYTITPEAWVQMLSDSSTAAIGLMGNVNAEPIDWYRNSPYFKLRMKPE
jgi:hypothetical protein